MIISEELWNREKCEQVLSVCNFGNRPFRQAWVDFLAKEMEEGRFLKNGDSFKFAKEKNKLERLIDGQHRMKAMIKANKSYIIPTIRGLEDEVFSTLDRGLKRSTKDDLFNNFDNSSDPKTVRMIKNLSVVIVMALEYEKQGKITNSVSCTNRVKRTMFWDEKNKYFLEHQRELEIACFYHSSSKNYIPESMQVFLKYEQLKKHSFLEVNKFWGSLYSAHSEDSRISLLKEQIDIIRGNKKNHRKDNNLLKESVYFSSLCAVARTWNAIVTGESYKSRSYYRPDYCQNLVIM